MLFYFPSTSICWIVAMWLVVTPWVLNVLYFIRLIYFVNRPQMSVVNRVYQCLECVALTSILLLSKANKANSCCLRFVVEKMYRTVYMSVNMYLLFLHVVHTCCTYILHRNMTLSIFPHPQWYRTRNFKVMECSHIVTGHARRIGQAKRTLTTVRWHKQLKFQLRIIEIGHANMDNTKCTE